MSQNLQTGINYLSFVKESDYSHIITMFPALQNCQLFALKNESIGDTTMRLLLSSHVEAVIGKKNMQQAQCKYVTFIIDQQDVLNIDTTIELLNSEAVHDFVPNFIGKAMRYAIKGDRNGEYYQLSDVKEVLGIDNAGKLIDLCNLKKVPIQNVYSY